MEKYLWYSRYQNRTYTLMASLLISVLLQSVQEITRNYIISLCNLDPPLVNEICLE